MSESMPGHVTACILTDGCCARPRQMAADRPGALAEIAGRPRIYHLLDSLARLGLSRVVLCCGQGQGLEEALGPGYRGMELLYSSLDTPLDSGGALRLALNRHPAELILAINDDFLADADLSTFLSWFKGQQSASGALLLVPVDEASGFGCVCADAEGRVTGFNEKSQEGPGWISAGVCLLRPGCLQALKPGQPVSLESDLLPGLAASGLLRAFKARARFLDLGRAETLAQAGLFLSRRNGAQSVPAVFLDRDGTVIAERHYLSDPAGVELLPGAAEGMRRMSALGLPLVLVTNQSGVGRGYFGRDAVERVHGRLLELLEAEGLRLDGLYACPHAPQERCACRKPLPGLLQRAGAELRLDLAASFVVGDKPCDVELGQGVGATSFLVRTGYGADHAAQGSCAPQHVVDDLLGAARRIEAILERRRQAEQQADAGPGGQLRA